MAKLDPDTIARQLADTADAIVTLRVPWKIEAHIAKKWEVSTRQARKWMSKVRAKWRADATTDSRDSRRDDARATLTHIIALALTRTQLVKDSDGETVYAMERVQNEHGETVERRKLTREGLPIPMTRSFPDFKAALNAQAQLRALDALDAPFTNKLEIVDGLKRLPDVKSLDAQGFEDLRALISRLAPNSDLRQLAGDLFFDPASNRDVN